MTNEHSGDRLRQFLAQKHISPSQCAQILGVSNQVLNNWFSRGIPSSKIFAVAPRIGAKVEWLMAGRGEMEFQYSLQAKLAAAQSEEGVELSNASMIGPMDLWDDETPLDDDEVYVPFLKEVELSAGTGRTVVEQSNKQKLRFGKLTLRRQNVQPSEAVCVTVIGNSMEPVLPDGSTVGVDQGSVNVVDGKMYALNHDGQLRVKTLYRLPGGGVRLRSFNRDEHPDEEYSAQEMLDKQIVVLGRVFWSSVLW
ncbi:LexA family transcriptional regulator [Pseudomonas syringae]|uniref:LexA family transcriptional regulator n=1 Tax=Pseudomonas syringae TaxID=317 RepID=UPI0013C36276|nr:helix-turn-helix transcriptional regulator [Pseudomonas syringae]